MLVELTDIMYQRGLTALGDAGRTALLSTLDQRKEPLVYGAIGGSITAGASADSPQTCYAGRFASWLDQTCPGGCTLVNAGIGASNSLFGAYRAGKDLLSAKPDIITLEYAVNDTNNPEIDASYENLVRQCLNAENQPTVILLFTMKRDGSNMQRQHIAIGRHYGLPMLSYRDAIYPEIEAGKLRWEDISPDEVHPNNDGHAFIADMLARLTEDAISRKSAGAWPQLPQCLHERSARLENGCIVDAAGMKVERNTGWKQGPHKGGYIGFQADAPGAELSLTFTGRIAYLGYQKKAGDFGRIEAVLDGGAPMVFDGFFERPQIQAWAGGHTVVEKIMDAEQPGLHTLQVRLLEQKHPDSKGHMFDIGYLLIS